MSDNARKIDINDFKEKITSYGFVKGESGEYIGCDKLGCINITDKSILIAIYGHNKKFDSELNNVIKYLYPSQSEKVSEILSRTYIDETIEEDGITAYATGIKDNTFLRVAL
ncbi:MAG: hypothetical protein Q4F66_01800 [Clostridium sp.]|nr:hypothetical protein [Clostridium sp.]